MEPENTSHLVTENDPYESKLFNTPAGNSFREIYNHQLNIFPHFLLCNIFNKTSENVQSSYKGVGVLIGPSIILTVGHNLFRSSAKNSVLISHILFENFEINNDHCYVPNEYKTALEEIRKLNESIKANETKETREVKEHKAKLTEEAIKTDWGLIFLPFLLGDAILSKLEIAPTGNLQVIEHLYKFFNNNQYELTKNAMNICIVGTIFPIREEERGFTKGQDSKRQATIANRQISRLEPEPIEIISRNDTCNYQLSSDLIDIKEGLVNTSRFYNPNTIMKKESCFENDYHVLNVSNRNSSPKQIQFVSTGPLYKNGNKEMLKYLIDTEQGHSGSMLLLEVDSTKPSLEKWLFIGLHSSRGPSVIDDWSKDAQLNPSPKQEKMIMIDRDSISIVDKNRDGPIYCEYNQGINVLRKKSEIIQEIHKAYQQSENYFTSKQLNPKYYLVNLGFNGNNIVKGLFRPSTDLKQLRQICSDALDLPSEKCVSLRDIDRDRRLDPRDVLSKVIKDQEPLNLSICVLEDVCGKEISEVIIDDYVRDSKNKVTRLQIEKEPRAHHVQLLKLIGGKYASMEKDVPLYGLLFKRTRDALLKKINFEVDSE